MNKTLSIGADHGGFKLKQELILTLTSFGMKILDKGCFDENSVDYPDLAHAVCSDVQSSKADFGVLVCTSGIGMSIAANKHEGIRAALCHNLDSAKFSRLHNNANVICLGAKYTDSLLAAEMVKTFASTEFEGGRHERRVCKMMDFEK